MPDYRISEEALEAAGRALGEKAVLNRDDFTRQSLSEVLARQAINAFLAAEGFEVEENVLPTSYEKRLVGPWRAFEG